jgi:tetratricopeptide (TPR) repeat protein
MGAVLRVKTDHAARRYEKIVLDYFAAGGLMIVVSDDDAFVKALRFTIGQIKADARNLCREMHSYDEVVTFLGQVAEKLLSPALLFLERKIHRNTCIKTVKVLKNFYPEKVRIIVVSSEISRDEIVLAHEVGADSFITKPISANAIIEKAAFVIKPNNQLGVLIERCASLIEDGELDEAEKMVAKIMEVKPESLKGNLLLGDIYRRRGDLKKCEEHYLAASKSEKLYIEPLKKLVELSKDAGNLDKKLFFLNKLDKLSPLNFERKVEIGETYLEKDEPDKAREYFSRAKKVVLRVADEMVSESLMEIARKIGEKDRDLALEYMNEAIEVKGASLSRSDLWMFNNRGILLRRQGKWQEAVDNYKKALTLAPDDAGVHYNIGVAYAEGVVFDKALEYFEKAAALSPEILKQAPSIPYNIAMAAHRRGQIAKAKEMLAAALALDPNYEPAKRLAASMRK